MLGRSIKDYMTAEGLKANVIAARAGIKENVFSAMVNEKRKISAEEYFAICRALNVPLDRFVEGKVHA